MLSKCLSLGVNLVLHLPVLGVRVVGWSPDPLRKGSTVSLPKPSRCKRPRSLDLASSRHREMQPPWSQRDIDLLQALCSREEMALHWRLKVTMTGGLGSWDALFDRK